MCLVVLIEHMHYMPAMNRYYTDNKTRLTIVKCNSMDKGSTDGVLVVYSTSAGDQVDLDEPEARTAQCCQPEKA